MAKKFKYKGARLTITAGADYVAGRLYQIGALNMVGVALNDAASGEDVTFALEGVWEFTVASGDTAVVGAIAYVAEGGDTAEVLDTDGGSDHPVGRFLTGGAAGSLVDVKLIDPLS